MNLAKTPILIQKLFNRYQWSIMTELPEIFLTFDDGPTPGVTDWVLDLLREHHARATFFCVGKNVKRYPDLARRIVQEGHRIGNHTYSHLSGWSTEGAFNYLNEVQLTDKIIAEVTGSTPLFFRPPYGRISPFAQHQISLTHKIVMWDIIAWDWDMSVSAEDCYEAVVSNFQYGSIIVLHDSIKCASKLEKVLPALLDFFQANEIRLSPLRC